MKNILTLGLVAGLLVVSCKKSTENSVDSNVDTAAADTMTTMPATTDTTTTATADTAVSPTSNSKINAANSAQDTRDTAVTRK